MGAARAGRPHRAFSGDLSYRDARGGPDRRSRGLTLLRWSRSPPVRRPEHDRAASSPCSVGRAHPVRRPEHDRAAPLLCFPGGSGGSRRGRRGSSWRTDRGTGGSQRGREVPQSESLPPRRAWRSPRLTRPPVGPAYGGGHPGGVGAVCGWCGWKLLPRRFRSSARGARLRCGSACHRKRGSPSSASTEVGAGCRADVARRSGSCALPDVGSDFRPPTAFRGWRNCLR